MLLLYLRVHDFWGFPSSYTKSYFLHHAADCQFLNTVDLLLEITNYAQRELEEAAIVTSAAWPSSSDVRHGIERADCTRLHAARRTI